MSFWGAKVAPGSVAKVEAPAGELLHLSQACLDPATPSGASAKVLVEQGGTSYALAVLKEGGQEFCALDLFLDAKEAKLKVTGKATVHLTGYFESEEEEEPVAKTGAKKSQAAKTASPAAKPASPAAKPASPAAKPAAPPAGKAEAEAKGKQAAEDEEDDDDDDEDEEEEPPKKKHKGDGKGSKGGKGKGDKGKGKGDKGKGKGKDKGKGKGKKGKGKGKGKKVGKQI